MGAVKDQDPCWNVQQLTGGSCPTRRALSRMLLLIVLAARFAHADGDVRPQEATAGKRRTALIVPDWRNCPITYSAGKGLVIQCDPMILAEIADLDGAPTKAMLEARAKELRELLNVPAADTKAETFQVGDSTLTGFRMVIPGSDRVVLALVAPSAGSRKSRRMTCMTIGLAAMESTCRELIAFFASPISLKEYAAAKSKAPWGRSFPDAANEALVKKLLVTAQGGGDSLRALVGDTLVIGPGLWFWLAPQDKTLSSIGTPSKLASANGPIPMRTLDAIAIGNFLQSKGAQLLFRRFRAGVVRAASTDERHAFYAVIPFEIEKVPVSVVERGQQSLLMYVNDGKLIWLELLTDPDKEPVAGDP